MVITKMNILLFSWRGPGHPHAGGAEESTHQHAKGWVKAGHKVTLFTSSYIQAKNEEIIDGVRIIRQGFQFFGVQWEALKWYLFKDHPKYDLVVDQFHGIPFFTPVYVKEHKLAFIHEVTKEVWRLNNWRWPFSLMPSIIGVLFEPLVFRLWYRKIPFMTVSDSTKKDLIEWGIPTENITVIHNGINEPKQRAISSFKKEKVIIFLGALSKDKGIEDALQIFSILKNTLPGYKFWIVGKGEENFLKYLKQISNKLKLDKKVKFWGFVSEEEKYKLLAKAQILINPSVREGWGLVVIEAAFVGTPTVGYNVVGLKDSIVDNETGLLSLRNPKSLAESIIRLVRDQKQYNKMSINCKKRAKLFRWDKSVGKSLMLLNRLAVSK